MIKFEIKGTANKESSYATIGVDIDPNTEHHTHADFDVQSTDHTSVFRISGIPIAMINHDVNKEYRSSKPTDTFKLLGTDSTGNTKQFDVITVARNGVTVHANGMYKNLGFLEGIGDTILDECYDKHPVYNGMEYTAEIDANSFNNPFLEYKRFKTLPDVRTKAVRSKYEGINTQKIIVGNYDVVARVEDGEIVNMNFPRINQCIDISNSGDDSFGSTVVKVNHKISDIRQSKLVAHVAYVTGTGIVVESLADGNDEYEIAIGKKASELVVSILKSSDYMSAWIAKGAHNYDHINVYYITLDQSNYEDVKEYFYISDHSSFWALYKADLKEDGEPVPIKITIENLKVNEGDKYTYMNTYYDDFGDIVFEKTIVDGTNESHYTETTKNYKLVCDVERTKDESKYTIAINRETGGSGHIADMIERLADIAKYGSDKYIDALETIIEYNDNGYFQPINMYRYLTKTESICRNPQNALRWNYTLFNPKRNNQCIDTDLLLNPGDIFGLARLILWYKGVNEHGPCEEYKLLEKIEWNSFMLPSDFKCEEEPKRERRPYRKHVSNACEAMAMDVDVDD